MLRRTGCIRLSLVPSRRPPLLPSFASIHGVPSHRPHHAPTAALPQHDHPHPW